MFVCLWSPAWRTVADSLADLSPALLTVAPRVVTEERRGGLVWVDARGLDAERIARSAIEVLRGLGLSNVRVGIGTSAIVAEVVAWGLGTGDWGLGREALTGSETSKTAEGSRPSPQSPVPSPYQSPSPQLESLGTLPISVLEPDPALKTLLDGIGVETCGDLMALAGESVEVRLGADGVRLWKLARGVDDRLIFAPMPRELPHASLEWSDYVLTDTERLLFSVNALLGTVCEKLAERGSLSREMALDLKLARGDTLTTAVRAGRATASRKTWLRLARATLERMVLPAGVVGIALRAAVVVTDDGHQGDLFDRGFATAAATEAALASLAEEQGDVVVMPENSAHPLVERRTKWIEQREAGSGKREAGGGRRNGGSGGHPKPTTRGCLTSETARVRILPSLFPVWSMRHRASRLRGSRSICSRRLARSRRGRRSGATISCPRAIAMVGRGTASSRRRDRIACLGNDGGKRTRGNTSGASWMMGAWSGSIAMQGRTRGTYTVGGIRAASCLLRPTAVGCGYELRAGANTRLLERRHGKRRHGKRRQGQTATRANGDKANGDTANCDRANSDRANSGEMT